VQRPGDTRATAWLDAPLPNSSVEQWRIAVIVTGYTLFVTSHHDIIFTFANQHFGEVCWHNMHILDFLVARIAAINLFQVDLDKTWNYLWYCCEKQRCCRWGCKPTPKSFADLLKIWEKSLKIRVKMAPNVVWHQKMIPKVHGKTHEDLFLEATPKKVFVILVGKNLWAKIAQKAFRASLGKFGQESFALPEICVLLHLWWKVTFVSIAHLLQGRREKCPHHASILRRPCA